MYLSFSVGLHVASGSIEDDAFLKVYVRFSPGSSRLFVGFFILNNFHEA